MLSTSGQKAKQKLHSQGSSLREWAEKNGYPYRLVSDVVRGVNRGTYGKGHDVARKLGMTKESA
jgi:gp16 family phage-associated protein